MNFRVLVVGLTLVGIVLGAGIPALGQEPEGTDSATAAMMAKWEEHKALGKAHEQFQEAAGKGTVTTTFWMDPAAPPEQSQGAAEFKTIFGGRYLVQDYTGEYMGQSFKGMGITAFDNFRQEYIDIWLDEMGTGVYISRGTMDEAGKVLTTHGTMDDVLTGRKDVPARSVSTKVDADTQRLEMYTVDPSGKEFKSMEIVYKRQK